MGAGRGGFGGVVGADAAHGIQEGGFADVGHADDEDAGAGHVIGCAGGGWEGVLVGGGKREEEGGGGTSGVVNDLLDVAFVFVVGEEDFVGGVPFSECFLGLGWVSLLLRVVVGGMVDVLGGSSRSVSNVI